LKTGPQEIKTISFSSIETLLFRVQTFQSCQQRRLTALNGYITKINFQLPIYTEIDKTAKSGIKIQKETNVLIFRKIDGGKRCR
jgi:uncharacterized protein (UPF0216 family)